MTARSRLRRYFPSYGSSTARRSLTFFDPTRTFTCGVAL